MKEYKVTVDKLGTTQWYHNGQKHREDGPAVVMANGNKEWWVNGKNHRLDGPAVVREDGNKEWWIDGVEYTESEFLQITQPAKELTIAQIEEILGHKIKVVK